MSSISPISATPPSIPLTAAKPAVPPPPATGPGSPVDNDGDHDGGAPDKVSAAKSPGTGTVLDIKA